MTSKDSWAKLHERHVYEFMGEQTRTHRGQPRQSIINLQTR